MSDSTITTNGTSWPILLLGEIAEVKLGKMLDKAKHRTGRRLPYLRNINVRWGTLDTSDLLEMNFEDDELDRFGLKDGDVLVCEGGEPGRAAVWNDSIPNVKYQKAIHRIRFKQPYEPRLLVYLLQLLAKTGRLERRFTGSTIKHFTREAIVQLPIPVPPLDEQQRIVAEIGKQFTRLDAGAASLKRVQTALKRYRARVLKAACEGAWPRTTVAKVATDVRYGTSAKTTESPSGVPVIRMGNIIDGRLSLEKLKFLPNGHREFPDLLLKSGDLLFNRTNSAELVGKTAVYHGTPEPCSFASYLIRVRVNPEYSPDFLSYYLNSAHGRKWIASVVSQQVGQANVNGTKLKALEIPNPPLADQTRIVAEVERRLSVVEELDAVVSANLQRATRLRQSILQKAFSGAL